jgi:5-methylthioadenosine/S-adenosylhomocysteine deaminase
VAYLEGLGFLGPGVLGAHGVWVSDADIQVLKTHNVGIAHNPESNMKTASGVAPIPAYLKAGVPVGLATDGAASNNDLDMFEAMRFAALLAKNESKDPSTLSARTVLEMATIRGARALGMAARLGSLEAKKRADLITVSVSGARQMPMYDPISHLVYVIHGDDVRNSIVNGKILMRDRKVLTLDDGAVIAEARAWAEKVRSAVKPPATSR